MHDFRLRAQPCGKSVQIGQIFGVGNAAYIGAFQRVIDDVNAGQIISRPVRGFAEIDPLVKIFDKAVIEGQARQHGGADERDGQHGEHEGPSFGNHHIGQPLH